MTDAGKLGRDQFVAGLEGLGMSVHIDVIGDIWGNRQGTQAGPPAMIGLYTDSVVTGGLLDGVAGVNDAGIATVKPIAVSAFTNEEDARFAPDTM